MTKILNYCKKNFKIFNINLRMTNNYMNQKLWKKFQYFICHMQKDLCFMI